MNFGEKIYHLRKKGKMSQEEMAEVFRVSRRAVQKWENGTSLPETSKLIEISKYFSVSLDSLVLERNERMAEETKAVLPCYGELHDWEFYGSALDKEYRQCVDEGLDIEQYKSVFEAVAHLPKNRVKNELASVLQSVVLSAPTKDGYKYNEPSDLEGIKALRKELVCVKKEKPANLRAKIYEAWTGRICGCMLGKTVEGIRTAELERFLKETDNFPMKRYIRKTDFEKVDLSAYSYDFAHRAYADDIDRMPNDDDTNYTVLAQLVFDEHGSAFTPAHIADAWLKYQPKEAYCTAERVAFCNFVKGYRPPESAVHKNPYREWIGAQIRADYWGYINPADPETAAEMAWRDASVSHVKNGIYGAMFVAAAIAAAAAESDAEKIILAGLSQIPCTSRLFEDVMHVVELYKSGKSQKEAFRYIHSRYDEGEGYGWCHTNPNAMIVAASLLYGEGDFGKTVCMAVETGFDTDCNGATAGSILGTALGIDAVGKEWSAPFNDTLNTLIFGLGDVKISERAELTLKHIDR